MLDAIETDQDFPFGEKGSREKSTISKIEELTYCMRIIEHYKRLNPQMSCSEIPDPIGQRSASRDKIGACNEQP